MPPRLLTLLGLIETALVNQGSKAVAAPPNRSVSFHKGVARMSFSDGSGSILLENFTLADGQICVKAVFFWGEGAECGSFSIYPREKFDWNAAADQIATACLASRPQPVAQAKVTTTTEPAANGQTAAATAAG